MRLKNFIGVKKGMELDEIEIHIPKSDSPITVLRGDNGSGKTTILSNLQPYHESNDIKSRQIIEGEDGEKHIDMVDGSDLYECKIYYKATKTKHTTKCYIMKNGVELNVNGNISSYNDILEKSFGLTKDYFKLGRIGSNVSNFIDLSRADRKKYISKILPDIDKYLKYYAIVHRKYSEMKTKIKHLSERLENIPNKTELQSKEGTIITNLSKLETNMGIINKDFGYYEKVKEDTIEKMDVIRNANVAFFDNVGRLHRQYKNNKIQITAHIHDMDGVETMEDVDGAIIKNTSEIDTIRNNISMIQQDNESLTDRIQKNTSNLSELKKDVMVIDEDTEKQIVERERLLSESIATLQEFCEGDDFFGKIKELRDSLQMSSSLKSTSELLSRFSSDLYGYSDMYSDNKEHEVEKELFERKNELVDVRDKISRLEANLDQYELLQKRPSLCSIDTCPFISNSLQFKNVKRDYDTLVITIPEIQKSITELESTMSGYSDMNAAVRDVNFMITTISNKEDVNRLLDITIKDIDSLFKLNVTDINIVISNISDIIQTIAYFNELNKKTYDLKLAKSKINEIKSNKKLFNSIKGQIVSYEEDNKNLNNKLNNNITNIKDFNSLSSSLINKNEILNTITALSDKINEHESFITIKESYDVLNKELMVTKSSMMNLDSQMMDIRSSISNFTKTLDNIKIHLKNIDTFNADRAEVEQHLEDVILVKDALDIKKGIPLIFTQEYLNGIKVYVNRLIELAFPNMTISFNITEKEFGIYVSDIFTREIEDLSQGEMILVKISFSIGLIQSMLSKMKYDILYFDEIDSALDVHRKTAVIDLLNKQSEFLGIEQMFLISHNEMLDNMDINVIELTDRDDDVSKSANVIWSIKDCK